MAGRKTAFGVDFSRVRALIVFLVDAMLAVALVLLLLVDRLVNVTLYGYGLTFDVAWAQPYWTMLRTSLVLIVLAIMAISLIELPFPSFQKKRG
jgi:hypothetical protein